MGLDDCDPAAIAHASAPQFRDSARKVGIQSAGTAAIIDGEDHLESLELMNANRTF
jgi:hypothetical protein